jgi:hypothetical protein
MKDTTDTARSASYLDLHFESDSDCRLRTKLYDKRDDFNFAIVSQMTRDRLSFISSSDVTNDRLWPVGRQQFQTVSILFAY